LIGSGTRTPIFLRGMRARIVWVGVRKEIKSWVGMNTHPNQQNDDHDEYSPTSIDSKPFKHFPRPTLSPRRVSSIGAGCGILAVLCIRCYLSRLMMPSSSSSWKSKTLQPRNSSVLYQRGNEQPIRAFGPGQRETFSVAGGRGCKCLNGDQPRSRKGSKEGGERGGENVVEFTSAMP